MQINLHVNVASYYFSKQETFHTNTSHIENIVKIKAILTLIPPIFRRSQNAKLWTFTSIKTSTGVMYIQLKNVLPSSTTSPSPSCSSVSSLVVAHTIPAKPRFLLTITIHATVFPNDISVVNVFLLALSGTQKNYSPSPSLYVPFGELTPTYKLPVALMVLAATAIHCRRTLHARHVDRSLIWAPGEDVML